MVPHAKIPSVILCLFLAQAAAIEGYCSQHHFPSRGSYMQFTREPSTAEFAVVGKFKGLHCCARGYRSIEWYKDGRPYPWHGTVSELIIYPESANQTVYTQTVKAVDAGNYTCLLRNDSVVHAHTIQLTVFDKVPDDPKITYISQDMQVSLGQSIRLFCEAFGGRVDLPDAYNEAVWRRSDQNSSLEQSPHIHQEKISREYGQTFGTYLKIHEMTKEDYGEYICTISKPGKTIELSTYLTETIPVKYVNPNPVPIKKVLLWSAIAVVVLVTLLIFNLQYGLFLRVHMKDRFGKLLESEDKINDVLIVYSQKDSEVVLGVLLPSLEAKYNYKCGTKELPENINLWCTNLAEASRRSHRIVAVLSPSCLNEKWEKDALYEALKQLYDLDPNFCCIVLKPIPSSPNEVKNSRGETLSSIVRNIHVIQWERANDDRFWLSLRLRLPPKRHVDTQASSLPPTQIVNSTRLNVNSQELDNFV